jgi:hypothetical protein
MKRLIPISAAAIVTAGLLAGCAPTSSPEGRHPTSSPGASASHSPSSPSAPAGSRATKAPDAGAAAPETAPSAGLDEAKKACQVVSAGLADGTIGVPASAESLAPATASAIAAESADQSWSALAAALSDFVEGATASRPDVQRVNQDLERLDAQCAPIGAPMPAS